jgi:hypothetical protein
MTNAPLLETDTVSKFRHKAEVCGEIATTLESLLNEKGEKDA